MRKKYSPFLPRTYAQKAIWVGNFGEKIPASGLILGFTPAEVAELTDAALNHKNAIQQVEIKSKELDQARAVLALSTKTDLKLIMNAAVAAKRKSTYNDTIGSELGIISTNQNIDLNVTRPNLRLVTYPGVVEVNFLLQGLKGVTIYSRLKGTLGWTMLTHDYESPYKDTRPLTEANKPEIREYMARFFDGRSDIGRESDIAVITFGG